MVVTIPRGEKKDGVGMIGGQQSKDEKMVKGEEVDR
jgi:hypothetical protein